MIALRRTLQAWLELVRPPNVFTVPGDPLAGFILAGGGYNSFLPVVYTVTASSLLYMAGLIWNDYADAPEDAQSRPERPIPSGRVTRKHALIAAIVLTVAGVASAWLATPFSGFIAILLAGLVLTYNLLARKSKTAGVITMGLCRGTSLLLGATAANGSFPTNMSPWVAATGITLYIIVVSLIAHGETKQQRLGLKPWFPVMMGAALVAWAIMHNMWATGIATVALMWLMMLAWPLRREPHPKVVQKTIGSMIRVLLPIQAGLCVLVPETGWMAAVTLLCMWPVSSLVGKWFYGS